MQLEQLKSFCPTAAKFYDGLIATFDRYQINTPKRQAQFLAQLAHESAGFRYVRELASGEAYDTGRLAKRLGNTPEDDDDGRKFKGRGLIQVTGTTNYRNCSQALFGDDRLLKKPEILEEPLYACLSAGWYWDRNKLNDYADADRFTAICGIVNTGSPNTKPERINGYKDRRHQWDRARRILGARWPK